MTMQYQKIIEVMYAEETGKLLNESWKVEPSPDEVNWPDLIVETQFEKFGLEVREIYLDELKSDTDKLESGSDKKMNENYNLKMIQQLAAAYYKEQLPSIKVDFLRDIRDHDKLLNTIKMEAMQLLEFEQKRIEPYEDCVIYIRRLPEQFGEYKKWNYVSDKVGWVNCVNEEHIEKFIAKKAEKLAKYTKNISDVRLLLVSNRIFNSGKACVKSNIISHTHGFKEVYYLSFPETVLKLRSQ